MTPARPKISPTRTTATALAAAVLLAVAALVAAPAPIGAAPGAPADGLPITELDPVWALGSTYGPTDPAGNTYVRRAGDLPEKRAPFGMALPWVDASGTGSVGSAIAVTGATDDVYVVGTMTGTLSFGLGEPAVTIDAGPSMTQFVLKVAASGAIEWGRTFALVPDATRLVANDDGLYEYARFNGSATFEHLTVTSDGPALLVAGIDGATGAADWITTVSSDDGADRDLDLTPGPDSVVLTATTGSNPVLTSTAGPTPLDCEGGPSEECAVIAELATADGEPRFTRAKPLYGTGSDGFEPQGVVPAGTGYAVVGRELPDLGTHERVLVQRLDASGDVIWSRPMTSSYEMGRRSVAVGPGGEVVVTMSLLQGGQIGDGPDAIELPWSGEEQILLVEYDRAGRLVRYAILAGEGSRPPEVYAGPALTIDRHGAIHIVGEYGGPITVGTGPGAITLEGSGAFVAAFPPAPVLTSTFHPVEPVRLLDSRTTTGGWNAKLDAATPRPLTVAGTAGVPADATAVVLNLTATDVTDMTYLTAWPTGEPRPTASNLNVVAGDTISNHATVAVGVGGQITLATAQGSINVVADLFGYFTADDTGDGYHAITPTRLLDSRTTTGGWSSSVLPAGTPRTLTVAGAGGIPAGATTAVLAVTVTDTSDLTYLRVQPTGSVATNSNLAVNPGQTITNLVTAPIGTDGQVTFTNNTGSVNVVADAVGYYDDDPGGAHFWPITPTRVLDSRVGTGGWSSPWAAGATRAVPLPPFADGDPTRIRAIAANLTATDTTQMSYATLFPEPPVPSTSSLLFVAGQTVAAAAYTGVAPGGTVSVFNQLGSANLVLDLNGYFVRP